MVFLRGTDAVEVFLDDDKVSKVGSVPPPIMRLFSGDGLVNMIDGDAAASRKQLLLSAFEHEACLTYVPILERVCRKYLEKWADAPQGALMDDLKALCVEAICASVFGIEDQSELDEILGWTDDVIGALVGLPINVPGTAYNRGVKAVSKIVDRYTALVEAQVGKESNTGVGRMLAARTDNGKQLSPRDIAREMHHAVLAGFIVFAELAAILVEFEKTPRVRDTLAAEVAQTLGAGAIDGAKMREMPYLYQVSQETKRFTRNVPFGFWTAKKDFEFQGYSIKKGWGLLICTTATTRMSEYWAAPETFDPARFGPERNEEGKNPNAFIPQGAGPMTGHRCLGTHFSTYLIQIFALMLVRDYAWTLPEQDLSLNLKLVTPEQHSGLIVDVTRKQPV